MKEHKGFTGQLGFVLAAAGSAVGVGNLGASHILPPKMEGSFPYYISGFNFYSRFCSPNYRPCDWS